jgi:hypothetical protein
MTKIVILSYFSYKNLGEVKIWSLVQEISSKDKLDNTFLNLNLPLEHDKTIFRSWNLVLGAITSKNLKKPTLRNLNF